MSTECQEVDTIRLVIASSIVIACRPIPFHACKPTDMALYSNVSAQPAAGVAYRQHYSPLYRPSQINHIHRASPPVRPSANIDISISSILGVHNDIAPNGIALNCHCMSIDSQLLMAVRIKAAIIIVVVNTHAHTQSRKKYKNLAIANRLRVSCPHNTSRASMITL